MGNLDASNCFPKQTTISFVLTVLIRIVFAVHQSASSLIDNCNELSLGSLETEITEVSSAYFIYDSLNLKSLINNLKLFGPLRVPCGQPELILVTDDKQLFILTNCSYDPAKTTTTRR